MSLDDDIEAACEAAGARENPVRAKTDISDTFHVELREALWLLVNGGMSLQSILGEVRREVVEIAKSRSDTKAAAAESLGIDARTLYRVEQHRHKF